MSNQDFEIALQKYATLIVQIGLHVQAGDTILLQIQTTQAPLAHAIITAAYQNGAKEVLVDWQDQVLTEQWLQADALELDTPPAYQSAKVAYWCQQRVKKITVLSELPPLLKYQDAKRLTHYQATLNHLDQPLRTLIRNNTISWTVVAAAGVSWAMTVFPDLTKTDAVARLWHMIFEATHVLAQDPASAWQQQMTQLHQKTAWLNKLHFDTLHYQGPGTDLIVGLPMDHQWLTARSKNEKGETFIANLPTEEVFTAPDHRRIDGFVQSSRPATDGSQSFHGLRFKFSHGQLIDATTKTNQTALNSLLETDLGAAHLGEVALVPNTTPIARSGLTFYNTLFDENAACHLALGAAYPATLQHGLALNPLELQIAGLSQSTIHMDFVLATQGPNIDGLTKSGRTIPIFRNGNWAI